MESGGGMGMGVLPTPELKGNRNDNPLEHNACKLAPKSFSFLARIACHPGENSVYLRPM